MRRPWTVASPPTTLPTALRLVKPSPVAPVRRLSAAPWPYLVVLDLDEYWTACRFCTWRSGRYPTLHEARTAYQAHVCPALRPEPPLRFPLRVRLHIALAELGEWRLHRCACCGRISFQLRPANQDMPRAWARTWACTDRAACRARRH